MPLFHTPVYTLAVFWTNRPIAVPTAPLKNRRPVTNNNIEYKEQPAPIKLKFLHDNETATIYVPDWFQGVRASLKD